MRTIIGLTGYAGSGKDEAAKGLINNLGFERVSLAEPLRTALLRLDPMATEGTARVSEIVRKFGWTDAKAMFPEIRTLLQRLGTEVGRGMFGENFWVEQARNVIDQINPNIPIVITDVRFQNEVDMIRDAKGWVVKIERPGYGAVNGHISDTSIDSLKIDMTIYNQGTKDLLHDRITRFAQFCLANEPMLPFPELTGEAANV